MTKPQRNCHSTFGRMNRSEKAIPRSILIDLLRVFPCVPLALAVDHGRYLRLGCMADMKLPIHLPRRLSTGRPDTGTPVGSTDMPCGKESS